MHRRLNMRDAFPKSADEHAQQVVRLLQRRRADLDVAWEKLEEGWTANNERMADFGLIPRTSDEGVVKLNVGGLNIAVSWHLLAETEGFEDSILGALLEGVWGEGQIPRDADGRIVLDESPACIKHIIVQMMLRANGRSSSAAQGVLESAWPSAVAFDEAPCLTYTAHLMGLPQYVPAHSTYVKMNGGSTILEPFEIAPFGAKIREWIDASFLVDNSTDELTLIYRATRDGFGSEAFTASCNDDSPITVSLIRVSSGQENEDDSVIGGYAVIPWGGSLESEFYCDDETFIFMLKDGSSTRNDLSMPIKWKPPFPFTERYNIKAARNDGPSFGEGDLVTIFDKASKGCTIQTKKRAFPTSSCPPFLALNGKKVVDIEVYRYSAPAPPTTAAPSITKPKGGTLTDSEAYDIRSFGETIASSLMEEKVVLDRAAKEMKTVGERVSAAVGALETMYGPSVAAGEQDAVVELNVRGTRMTTLRSTLQACPRSALAAMFNEDRWPATDKDKDEHGRRLIDCTPYFFSKILDVLRIRKRASWSRDTARNRQQESGGGTWGTIFVEAAAWGAFDEVVDMYFPGCESFIRDLVQSVTAKNLSTPTLPSEQERKALTLPRLPPSDRTRAT